MIISNLTQSASLYAPFTLFEEFLNSTFDTIEEPAYSFDWSYPRTYGLSNMPTLDATIVFVCVCIVFYELFSFFWNNGFSFTAIATVCRDQSWSLLVLLPHAAFRSVGVSHVVFLSCVRNPIVMNMAADVIYSFWVSYLGFIPGLMYKAYCTFAGSRGTIAIVPLMYFTIFHEEIMKYTGLFYAVHVLEGIAMALLGSGFYIKIPHIYSCIAPLPHSVVFHFVWNTSCMLGYIPLTFAGSTVISKNQRRRDEFRENFDINHNQVPAIEPPHSGFLYLLLTSKVYDQKAYERWCNENGWGEAWASAKREAVAYLKQRSQRGSRKLPKHATVGKTLTRKSTPGKITGPVFTPEYSTPTAVLWRIPIGPPVSPTVKDFSHGRSGFRQWVQYTARQLLPSVNKKHQVVCGNFAAKCLYEHESYWTSKVAKELFSQSSVFVSSYNQTGTTSVPGTHLGDYLPAKLKGPDRTVMVDGVSIETEEDLVPFLGNVFKSKNNVVTMIRKLLGGDSSIDADRLQGLITKIVAQWKSKGSPTLDGDRATQGNVQPSGVRSPSFVVEHTVQPQTVNEIRNLGHDISAELHLLVDSVRATFEENRLNWVVSPFAKFVAFIAAVSAAKDARSIVVAIGQFMANFVEYIPQMFHKLPYSITFAQGFTDWFNGPLDAVKKLLNEVDFSALLTCLAAGIAGVMAATMEMPTYFIGRMPTLVFSIKKEIGQFLGKSLLESALYCFNNVLQRATRAIEVGSWKAFFSDMLSPSEWVKEVMVIEKYHSILLFSSRSMSAEVDKLRKAGELTSRWFAPVSTPEMILVCDELIELGKEISSYKHVNATGIITKKLDYLRGYRADLVVQENIQDMRPEPFGLYFYGPAGFGKSTAITNIIQRLSNVLENKLQTYYWNPTANFQDGLDSNKAVIVMDDVDHVDSNNMKLDFYEAVLTIINIKPAVIDAADIGAKGKVCARPMFVPFISNFREQKVMAKGAVEPFFRRFPLCFEIVVTDEQYLAQGKLNVDRAKYVEYDDWCKIKISEYCPKPAGFPYEEVGIFPYSEAVRYLFCAMQKHRAHQEEMLSRVIATGPTCGSCGGRMKDTVCPCGYSEEPSDKKEQAFHLCAVSPATLFYQVIGNPFRAMRYLEIGSLAITAAVGTTILIKIGKIISNYLDRRETQGLHVRIPIGEIRSLEPAFTATWTFEEMLKTVKKHTVRVECGELVLAGLHIARGLVLVPTHVAGLGDQISVITANAAYKATITDYNYAQVASTGGHLSLLHVPDLPACAPIFKYFFPSFEPSRQIYDEVCFQGKDGVMTSYTNVGLSFFQNSRVLVTYGPTVNGDCGFPYYARCGTGWFIAGVHNWERGTGIYVNRADLDITAQKFTYKLQACVMPKGHFKGEPKFGMIPQKSNVWSAYSEGARIYPYGTVLPRMNLSRVRDNIQKSILYDDLLDLRLEWTGEEEYYQEPMYKGYAENGFWRSPYTESMNCIQRNQSIGPYASLAIMDYLQGIDQLAHVGYRELSLDESLFGVDSSNLHGFDWSTSAGPPFNVRKLDLMKWEDGEVYWSEESQTLYDEYHKILDAGDSPTHISLWTLKPERLKKGKFARIFNVQPFPLNVVLKELTGSITQFMRNNPEFFECMVGINMTSVVGIDSFIRMMQKWPLIYCLDVKKLDKSIDGSFVEMIARVYYAINFLIARSAALKSYQFITGMINCLHFCENDAFEGCVNTSGNWQTVGFNSVLMSIVWRMVYYRSKYPELSDEQEQRAKKYWHEFFENPIPTSDGSLSEFRRDNSLAVYGDDTCNNTAYPYKDILQEFYEVGLTVTPASKDDKEAVGVPLEEAEFLKRTFAQVEGVWVARLDKKSILRSLLFKKKDTLSQVDQSAINLSGAAREMVFWGREEYDKFKALSDYLARKHSFEDNGNYRVPEFNYYRDQLLAGTFVSCEWE